MKPSLTLCIKDFGNIKEAEIDIAPMMLFIGHNNTGKSYVAMLWWGILDALEKFHASISYEPTTHDNYIKEWANQQQPGLIELPLDIFKYFINTFNKFLDKNKNDLTKNLFNSTEISLGEIKFKVNILSSLPKINWIVDNNLSPNGARNDGFNIITCDKHLLSDDWLIYISVLNFMKGILTGFHLDTNKERRYFTHPYYLPASRSGYMQTYKALTIEAHKRAWSFSNDNNNIFFTKPIITFLQNLTTANFIMRHYNDLCGFLEEQVLYGKIVEIKQPILNEYLFQPKGTDKLLSFHLTSSLVSELAPLIIFLRSHIIFSLIMEEPEAHLHPQAQRILIRTLAKLFNRNVPILLTTHSTTIFQQVNNLITLFNHPKQTEMLEKFGYSKDELLNPEDVVAYQFEETPEGTKISKLEKTETGFIAPTFSEGLYEFAKETRFVQEELDQDVD